MSAYSGSDIEEPFEVFIRLYAKWNIRNQLNQSAVKLTFNGGAHFNVVLCLLNAKVLLIACSFSILFSKS